MLYYNLNFEILKDIDEINLIKFPIERIEILFQIV